MHAADWVHRQFVGLHSNIVPNGILKRRGLHLVMQRTSLMIQLCEQSHLVHKCKAIAKPY